MAQVWKIAPGVGGEDWEVFRDHGCIGLGWLSDYDYRDFDSQYAVLAALEAEYGEGVPGASSGSAKMTWQFVHEVKPHHVVVANDRYNRVVGVGVITSDYLPPTSTKNPLRKHTKTHRRHVRRVDWIFTEPVDLPGKRFFVQSTLWRLENDQLATIRQAYAAKYPRLKTKLDQLLVGYQAGVSGDLPEEVADTSGLTEGAVRKVTVNAYERNPEARRRCIAAHGMTCCICGFNFGDAYGPEAEGYIHVHHVRPLSKVGEEYEVDPAKDLVPICPNCHAVVHLGAEGRSIEEVRKLRARQRKRRGSGDR